LLQALDAIILDETDTAGGVTGQTGPETLPRRSGRIICPSWKVIESRPEPPTIRIEPPPAPERRVVLLVREHFDGMQNSFGLSRTYKGTPSIIPDQPNSSTYIPSYHHPIPPQEQRTIEEIISPYPNLSSFLFDHHFWTSSTTKSRRDRDSTQELLIREDFKASDLLGVNLNAIEEELRGRPSRGQWEQTRGWRKTDLVIGIPKGIKRTAAVRRDEAAQNARQRRGVPEPPPSKTTPIPGAQITVPGFSHRSICEVIRETFSKDPAARTFHYHPYEQTHHSPLNPTRPPECVYDELFTADAWLHEDAKIQMASN
jgi:hypothetical protein